MELAGLFKCRATTLKSDLAMPTKCYLCDCAFDNNLSLKHGEHIIQNAIGGTLISSDILCKSCGGKLGSAVDTAFAFALSPLTVLLDIPRDRGDYSQAETRLIANAVDAAPLEQVQFILNSNFSVVPVRPVFFRSDSRRSVTVIGATRKQAEQYAKSANVMAVLAEGYALELSTNAAVYAQSLLVPVSPNSTNVLRGVLKIAIRVRERRWCINCRWRLKFPPE